MISVQISVQQKVIYSGKKVIVTFEFIFILEIPGQWFKKKKDIVFFHCNLG